MSRINPNHFIPASGPPQLVSANGRYDIIPPKPYQPNLNTMASDSVKLIGGSAALALLPLSKALGVTALTVATGFVIFLFGTGVGMVSGILGRNFGNKTNQTIGARLHQTTMQRTGSTVASSFVGGLAGLLGEGMAMALVAMKNQIAIGAVTDNFSETRKRIAHWMIR